MGIKGAAIASGLGQIISVLILSSHFIMKRGILKIQKIKLDINLMKKITKIGLPEFVTQMSQPITILCYNIIVIKYLGELGVSAFSVICYLLTLILGVFIGVSQGIQPLISKNYGEGNEENVNYFFKMGIAANVLLSFVVYIILLAFGPYIIGIFNSNTELITIAHEAIKTYGISFILAAVNIVCVTYFLSTKNTKKAMVIAITRGFILNSVFILVAPILFGTKSIWISIVISELVTMIIAIKLLLPSKQPNQPNQLSNILIDK